MHINSAASIPLVLHDPFFSIWSSSDHLYDADPVHWSGARHKIRGYLMVDDRVYCFLGNREFHETISQKSVDITATSTEYTFENSSLQFRCRFTSPLIPDDLFLLSRPCTYLDFHVDRKTAKHVSVHLVLSADLVRQSKDPVVGFAGQTNLDGETFSYCSMGRAAQQPLGSSGDKVTIDWGYLYAACKQKNADIRFDAQNEQITIDIPLGEDCDRADLILAYDDLLSINYFGQWHKGYWTHICPDILHAIASAFSDKSEVLHKAALLDEEVHNKAMSIGGEDYAFLCNMSFRHTLAAHKLIRDDEGNIIYLSKENDSNGCIGTTDISYPSIPLFLLYNTELAKGMLRPIFRFADCDVWSFDYAPHDVGRYPYAWGQVYGMNRELRNRVYIGNTLNVYPPFYLYPADSGIYDERYQMPVEECGNMLIMTAAVCLHDGNADFARPHWHLLSQWKEYLLKYGADPGDQLCTDDFAGHLSHNVNLSAKAIMGIEAYSKLCGLMGYTSDADKYHLIAKNMASDWEKRACAGDHYSLAFGNPDSWSLKYNLIWDKIWKTGLFSDTVYQKELSYYERQVNEFGVPLDNRADYTKSDWILWCIAMSDNAQQRNTLLAPVAHYLRTTSTRVPFSDWYDSKTGKYVYFIARSVQGGIFMPIYASK